MKRRGFLKLIPLAIASVIVAKYDTKEVPFTGKGIPLSDIRPAGKRLGGHPGEPGFIFYNGICDMTNPCLEFPPALFSPLRGIKVAI